ncbi:MAG: threonine ammonia-lyase IlvA [Cyclobacteriaceae bacterium]|nr:threonine ammonia-lyase IlvA [Cyclobacteriaceae bacterium]
MPVDKAKVKAYHPRLKDIEDAKERLQGVVTHTPLMENLNLSNTYGARIFLKREDLQVVRSYKIRGAYNKMSLMKASEREHGIVCASAGNHAQGVAYSCRKLGIHGTIFMPNPTPKQKINQVKMFGGDQVEIIIVGDTFDDSYQEAKTYCNQHQSVFIHPFNDPLVIEGQGTVGLEIWEDTNYPIDYLFLPVGGGGLASGVSSLFKQLSPHTKIIGVEPAGAPAMKRSIDANDLVKLDKIDKFVDGAAVQKVGDLTLEICREHLDEMVLVPEGAVCSTILKLYNEEAIVVEPAGALTIAALDYYRDQIMDQHVVCLVSGNNNDITRTEEIKERSLLFEGLKHYFIVRFPQRAGALREFLEHVLGPDDDITHFEYSKKNNREKGPALVGIEIQKPENLQPLLDRMAARKFAYEYLNDNSDLFQYLI